MPWNPETMKHVREVRGLTQRTLAERVGVHRITITRLENGDLKPGVDLFEALATVLRVRMAALMK